MFIGRNQDGSIYGLWTVRQWVGQEELADTNPDVVAFLNRPQLKPAPDSALGQLLVTKGVITANELTTALTTK